MKYETCSQGRTDKVVFLDSLFRQIWSTWLCPAPAPTCALFTWHRLPSQSQPPALNSPAQCYPQLESKPSYFEVLGAGMWLMWSLKIKKEYRVCLLRKGWLDHKANWWKWKTRDQNEAHRIPLFSCCSFAMFSHLRYGYIYIGGVMWILSRLSPKCQSPSLKSQHKGLWPFNALGRAGHYHFNCIILALIDNHCKQELDHIVVRKSIW